MKWFRVEEEGDVQQAQALRKDFEAGSLAIFAPRLLFVEILSLAGRRWQWPRAALRELATALPALGFRVSDPDILCVADWVDRGLTAYDASYVALAEMEGLKVITADRRILAMAPAFSVALAAVEH